MSKKKNKVKRRAVRPIKMWAVIVHNPRASWIHWMTLHNEKRGSWKRYLDLHPPEFHAKVEKQRKAGELELIKVQVQPVDRSLLSLPFPFHGQ